MTSVSTPPCGLGSSPAAIPTASEAACFDELDRLYAATSPGPWEAGHHPAIPTGGAIIRPVTFGSRVRVLPEWEGGHVMIAERDAAFIAAIHADFPKLIEAARRSAGGHAGRQPEVTPKEPIHE